MQTGRDQRVVGADRLRRRLMSVLESSGRHWAVGVRTWGETIRKVDGPAGVRAASAPNGAGRRSRIGPVPSSVRVVPKWYGGANSLTRQRRNRLVCPADTGPERCSHLKVDGT